MTNEAERAWAAGLFEGEGCFCWQRTDGRCYPKAYLATTDPDVLRRFARIVRVGRIYKVKRNPRWKPIESWVACGIDNIRPLAEVIGSYLGERRSQKLAEMLAWEPAERPPRRDYCKEPVSASQAGYGAHLRHNEVPCARCRRSMILYKQEWRHARVH